MKLDGSYSMATTADEAWFNEDDVTIMKAAGATCVEISIMPLPDLMPTRNVPDEAYFTAFVDKWAAWGEQHQLYAILDISSFTTYAGSGIWG